MIPSVWMLSWHDTDTARAQHNHVTDTQDDDSIPRLYGGPRCRSLAHVLLLQFVLLLRLPHMCSMPVRAACDIKRKPSRVRTLAPPVLQEGKLPLKIIVVFGSNAVGAWALPIGRACKLCELVSGSPSTITQQREGALDLRQPMLAQNGCKAQL